jgi:ABC-2 type transport system ATP-binding protein
VEPPAPDPTAEPEAAAAISARGLTRKFGPLVAVDGLDLEIAPGTIFGLLGANGAGKSTTIKMLTTLLPPSSGAARVAGFDVVRQARQVRRRVGYVPQLLSADSALTGRENLLLSARLYGIPRGDAGRLIEESLRFMGLGDEGNVLVRKYSGGMIRRLEIAQALLHGPDVLFLDEPTIGLDPLARQAVWDRLLDMRARTGTTVLLTTHDMEEAEALCQAVAIMHRGRIAVEGAPAALLAEIGPGASLSDVFARYIGGSLDEGGGYRDVARTRRTAKRLG